MARRAFRPQRFRAEPLEQRTLLAVTSAFDDGHLTITSDGPDDVVLSVVDGLVKVNDQDPTSGPLFADEVLRLDVYACVDTQSIDVSATRYGAFPNIQVVTYPVWDPDAFRFNTQAVDRYAEALTRDANWEETFGLSAAQALDMVRDETLDDWIEDHTLLVPILHHLGAQRTQDYIDDVLEGTGLPSFGVDDLGWFSQAQVQSVVQMSAAAANLAANEGLRAEVVFSSLEEEGDRVEISNAGEHYEGNVIIFTVGHSDLQDRDANPFSVDWELIHGTTSPADFFAATSGTLQWAEDEELQQRQVELHSKLDTEVEDDESFQVQLSNLVSTPGDEDEGPHQINDDLGTGILLDATNVPVASIEDDAAAEDDGPLSFKVKLDRQPVTPVTVTLAIFDGTAKLGDDYDEPATYEFTFSPGGPLEQFFEVPLIDDNAYETTENLTVRIDSVSENATYGDREATGSISDDDPLPTISISDASPSPVTEDDTTVTFTVALSAPYGAGDLIVNYSTSAGTATSGDDYIGKFNSALTFEPGQTQKSIVIAIREDFLNEFQENFFVTISSSLVETDASGEAKIDDDGDPAPTTPTISINDKTVLESDGSVVFRISLSEATDHDVTVQWGTAANPTDPKALASYDYGAAGGTATVPAGQTWVDLPAITIYNDALDEFDEMFRVELINPTGATLAEDYGIGTITDDDAPPVILINDVEVVEGDPGQDVKATFHVSLSAPSGKAIQVIALTGPVLALPSLDYVHKQSTLTFALNSTTGATQTTMRTFPVSIVEDLVYEEGEDGYEPFLVYLQSPVNATVGDPQGYGACAIQDDDTAVDLDIGHGQNDGTDFLSEQDEDGSGAVTVANKNDTDGDGNIDLTDGYVVAHSTEVPGDIEAGASLLDVDDASGFSVGDEIHVVDNGVTGNAVERRTITEISGNRITINEPLDHNYFYPDLLHAGRPEVDLMPLRINPPSRVLENEPTVTLTVDSGSIKLWQNSWKGQEIVLSSGVIEIPVYEIGSGRTYWVEATATSGNVKDISITLEYGGGSDTVKATGMWMEFDTSFDANMRYINSATGLPSEQIKNNLGLNRQEHADVDLALFVLDGTGLIPFNSDIGIANSILLRYTVAPAGVQTLVDSNSQPVVSFNAARHVDFAIWAEDLGADEWYIVDKMRRPITTELPNDEDAVLHDDESVRPDSVSGWYYSIDSPRKLTNSALVTVQGSLQPILASKYVMRFLAFEWMRVSFDGVRPTGDEVVGSRASDYEPWHVVHTLIRTGTTLVRSTGDAEEESPNNVDLGGNFDVGLDEEVPPGFE